MKPTQNYNPMLTSNEFRTQNSEIDQTTKYKNTYYFHSYWESTTEIAPNWVSHMYSNTYNPGKLFIRVDPDCKMFILLLKKLFKLAEKARKYHRGLFSYYCCYSIAFGYKPSQCAHIEHHDFKHFKDNRVLKHSDTFEEPLSKALFSLAGQGRYHFGDKDGREWIALPWLWKCDNITDYENFEFYFRRCFSSKEANDDDANKEERFEIEAWNSANA